MRLLFLLLMISLLACNKNEDENPFACGEEISLEKDIMPIINTYCTDLTCHGDGGTPVLNTKASVITYASKIRDEVVAGTMPANQNVLSADEIELIECWVADGAIDN